MTEAPKPAGGPAPQPGSEPAAPSGTPAPLAATGPAPPSAIEPAPRSSDESASPSADGPALLDVRDLRVHFPITRGTVFRRTVGHVHAVDGITLGLAAAETVGLVGESGSGKTTLGRAIVGLIPPTSGTILFRGRALDAKDGGYRAERTQLQMVFQDPTASLDPKWRAGASIAEPLRRQPRRDPRRAAAARPRAARGGRAVAGARPAIPARAVRRAAPAGGPGAGARAQPRGDRRRRGGQRARRVDPGADHQPAAGVAAGTGAVVSVHRPRPRGRPPPQPSRSRYVSGADRGAGRGGRSLYRSPASLHRVAAVGRAGARPVGRVAAGADHPARRSAEPRRAAAGVPVPHPVLAPGPAGRPRAVRGGGARPPAGLGRPHRGLPLHRRGAGAGRGSAAGQTAGPVP